MIVRFLRSTLLDGLKRRLFGALSRVGRVEECRDRAFKSLYAGIRTGDLKPAEALNVWDQLERFEENREQLVEGRLSAQNGQELLVGYQYLVDYVRACRRSLIHPEVRRCHTLHPQRFQRLYHGVRNGAISCEELKLGAYVRRLEPHVLRDSAVVRALHTKLWGAVA